MEGRNTGKTYSVDADGNHELVGFGIIQFKRYRFICDNVLSGKLLMINGKPIADEAKRAIGYLYGKGKLFEPVLFTCLRHYINNHFCPGSIRKRGKCVEFDEVNKLFDKPEGEKK